MPMEWVRCPVQMLFRFKKIFKNIKMRLSHTPQLAVGYLTTAIGVFFFEAIQLSYIFRNICSIMFMMNLIKCK